MAKEDEILEKARREALEMRAHSGPIPKYLDEYSQEIQQLPTITEQIAEEQMSKAGRDMPDMPEFLKDEMPGDFERRRTTELMEKAKMPEEMQEKLGKAARKGGLLKKLGKRLPLIGGVATALASGDVEAAIPLLGEAEELGPRKGSPDAVIEDPDATPEEREEAMRKIALQNASDSADDYFERVMKRRRSSAEDILEGKKDSADEAERKLLDEHKKELVRLGSIDPEKEITGEESLDEISAMMEDMSDEEADKLSELYKERRQISESGEKIEDLEERLGDIKPYMEGREELEDAIRAEKRKVVEPMLSPRRERGKEIIEKLRRQYRGEE
jgi:hypothetical protein